jgi:hypothetical protein
MYIIKFLVENLKGCGRLWDLGVSVKMRNNKPDLPEIGYGVQDSSGRLLWLYLFKKELISVSIVPFIILWPF